MLWEKFSLGAARGIKLNLPPGSSQEGEKVQTQTSCTSTALPARLSCQGRSTQKPNTCCADSIQGQMTDFSPDLTRSILLKSRTLSFGVDLALCPQEVNRALEKLNHLCRGVNIILGSFFFESFPSVLLHPPINIFPSPSFRCGPNPTILDQVSKEGANFLTGIPQICPVSSLSATLIPFLCLI